MFDEKKCARIMFGQDSCKCDRCIYMLNTIDELKNVLIEKVKPFDNNEDCANLVLDIINSLTMQVYKILFVDEEKAIAALADLLAKASGMYVVSQQEEEFDIVDIFENIGKSNDNDEN